ncbi:low molecular weight protein arginine phosphatase [Alkalibacter saccharofermentans]|uniref:Protein-tyrosine phosphatase n=1 Tax=Alkalibacter saccharofermentans DSM 14828 TaxID=1120975 RepID=A0A1M4Y2M9_9FIRM|nr:low molecular weight protein arginine phosphatase [Alkalibacter saccharofermentans]SHF00011.1 protein-tyrosine phosphatase [Alkalibacter saccharofermentans DSM 14828]
MKKILLVCTGNTCRSSMAKGIFEDLIKKEGRNDEIAIDSAGISVYYSEGANPNAILAAREMGIDISSHISKQVDEYHIANSDLVLTMTTGQKEILKARYSGYAFKIFTLKEFEGDSKTWDIADPFGGSLDIYKRTAKEIKDAITNLINNKKI